MASSAGSGACFCYGSGLEILQVGGVGVLYLYIGSGGFGGGVLFLEVNNLRCNSEFKRLMQNLQL
jgi:hypothetical protein